MRIPRSVLRHEVTVEPSQGNTGDGETYGVPYTLTGNLNRQRRVIRSRNGDTLVAEATLLLWPDAAIKVGDRVSRGGDVYVVEKVAPAEVGSHPWGLEVLLR